MLRRLLLSVVFTWLMVCAAASDGLLRVDYPGFTLWLDCAERAAVLFQYVAEADTGRLAREHRFTLDPDIPMECQQLTNRSYRAAGAAARYDRGHLVPANHLDHLADGISLSNRMVNILPQASSMNRGAWLRTEELIECYRDRESLEVWGGVLWGFDTENDHFLTTHGVRTPDYFWKVVISKHDRSRHIAWIVPNRSDATRARLDGYLAPVADIEAFAGVQLPVERKSKKNVPERTWPLPANCDKS